MNEGRSHFVERAGSALILAVVLVTLLAVVGVAFLLMSRIDRIATSSIADNMELEAAVQTLLATISQELVLDVPGVAGQEYHDYPGNDDPWLANLEPFDANGPASPDGYHWRQISDVTGYLAERGWSRNNIPLRPSDPNSRFRAVIPDLKPIVTDANGVLLEQLADADGDGVADSKWFEVEDIHSRKGHKIYAAVRIIDNGAMLNINTGYKFDPNDPNVKASDIDGSSLLQVNLMALSERPPVLWPPYNTVRERILLEARDPAYDPAAHDLALAAYDRNVVWRYHGPFGPYTPFDIADELELRYRFILNHPSVDSRLEELGKTTSGGWLFRGDRRPPQNAFAPAPEVPVTDRAGFDRWCKRVEWDGTYDPSVDPNHYYSYRHIVTTYNMDRIINASGRSVNNGRMANINRDSAQVIYNGLYAALLPQMGTTSARATAAQLAVNIVDYGDLDINITAFTPPGPNAVTYYGYEPHPFISEIGFQISRTDPTNSRNNDFAVELANPFDVDMPLSSFYLELRRSDGSPVYRVNLLTILPASVTQIGARSRLVVANSSGAMTNLNATGAYKIDPNLALATYGVDPNWDGTGNPKYVVNESFSIHVVRPVPETNPSAYIRVDKQDTDPNWFDWSTSQTPTHRSRPENNWNIVYQNMVSAGGTLGVGNTPNGTGRNYNLGGGNRGYRTVGDLSRVFVFGPSTDPNNMLGVKVANQPYEGVIRFDLNHTNPIMRAALRNVFNYVTVFDPNSDGIDNDLAGFTDVNEFKVPGRININTAPWFVMEQLPWIDRMITREIVRQRDTYGPFSSIADLMQVRYMDLHATNSINLPGFPDLTPGDDAIDDFEERDVFFSRISNLVTVRSDVFTAYIVVRLGPAGPQKRIIAILDRSDVYDAGDKVKIRAYQVVPDPR